MNNSHGLGELGEEGGFLHGGVAAAHDCDVVALEEEAVAGRAGGDTTAGELGFARNAQVTRCGAGGEDDGAGLEDIVAHVDALDIALELDGVDEVHAQVSAKTDGLGTHLFHELRAHDALLEAGVVLHLGGVHELAAVLVALEDDGLELGAGCVESCGVAGRAGADDDDVVDGVCRRGLGRFRLGGRIAEVDEAGVVRTGDGHCTSPL